jgi:teichuronic acid biosynthesis glycosyltransferase TuaH
VKSKVIFFSHTDMGSAFRVGSHHLVTNLMREKELEVFHISTPVSPFHLLTKESRKRLKYYFNNDRLDYIPFFIFPIGKIKFLDFSPVFRFLNKFFFKRMLKKTIGEITSDDVLIVDQPFYSPYLIGESARIFYRPTDIVSYMVGDKAVCYESLLKGKLSGLIATSGPVLEYYREFFGSDKFILLENGVPDYFLKEISIDYNQRSGVVYVGAFDYRFDFDLLFELAKRNDSIVFDLYGPIKSDVLKSLLVPENVFFKGQVEYSLLPDLLEKYKIGILPFNDHPSNQGRSPMKIYEYMSRGLVVLSKMTSEINRREIDFVYSYNDIEEADFFLKKANANNKINEVGFSNLSWSSVAKKLLIFLFK